MNSFLVALEVNQAYSEYKHFRCHLCSHHVAISMQPVHQLQIRPIVHN